MLSQDRFFITPENASKTPSIKLPGHVTRSIDPSEIGKSEDVNFLYPIVEGQYSVLPNDGHNYLVGQDVSLRINARRHINEVVPPKGEPRFSNSYSLEDIRHIQEKGNGLSKSIDGTPVFRPAFWHFEHTNIADSQSSVRGLCNEM